MDYNENCGQTKHLQFNKNKFSLKQGQKFMVCDVRNNGSHADTKKTYKDDDCMRVDDCVPDDVSVRKSVHVTKDSGSIFLNFIVSLSHKILWAKNSGFKLVILALFLLTFAGLYQYYVPSTPTPGATELTSFASKLNNCCEVPFFLQHLHPSNWSFKNISAELEKGVKIYEYATSAFKDILINPMFNVTYWPQSISLFVVVVTMLPADVRYWKSQLLINSFEVCTAEEAPVPTPIDHCIAIPHVAPADLYCLPEELVEDKSPESLAPDFGIIPFRLTYKTIIKTWAQSEGFMSSLSQYRLPLFRGPAHFQLVDASRGRRRVIKMGMAAALFVSAMLIVMSPFSLILVITIRYCGVKITTTSYFRHAASASSSLIDQLTASHGYKTSNAGSVNSDQVTSHQQSETAEVISVNSVLHDVTAYQLSETAEVSSANSKVHHVTSHKKSEKSDVGSLNSELHQVITCQDSETANGVTPNSKLHLVTACQVCKTVGITSGDSELHQESACPNAETGGVGSINLEIHQVTKCHKRKNADVDSKNTAVSSGLGENIETSSKDSTYDKKRPCAAEAPNHTSKAETDPNSTPVTGKSIVYHEIPEKGIEDSRSKEYNSSGEDMRLDVSSTTVNGDCVMDSVCGYTGTKDITISEDVDAIDREKCEPYNMDGDSSFVSSFHPECSLSCTSAQSTNIEGNANIVPQSKHDSAYMTVETLLEPLPPHFVKFQNAEVHPHQWVESSQCSAVS